MPKNNAFILYVERRRRDVDRETGCKYSLEEAIRQFGPEWTAMSSQDRVPYQRQAKKSTPPISTMTTAKPRTTSAPFPATGFSFTLTQLSGVVSDPANFQNRPTSLDLSSFHGEKPGVARKKFLIWLEANPPESLPNAMLGEDDDYFRTRNWQRYQIYRVCNPIYGDPTRRRFIVIEANIYGRSRDGKQYIPGEIGAAVFSFKEGLIDNFCALIDPGQPPLGVANVFKENHLKYSLPYPPFDFECENYAGIWQQLERFIGLYPTRGSKATLLFCREREAKKITGVLKWLADEAGSKVCPYWNLVPLGLFLFQLSKFAREKYFRWLKRQHVLEEINPAGLQPSSWYSDRSGFSSSAESDTGSVLSNRSRSSSSSFYSSSAAYSSVSDPYFISDSDMSSDDDDYGTRSFSSRITSRSRISLSSWTSAESCISIPDWDTKRNPERLSSTFMPRSSTSGIDALIKRLQQFELDVDEGFAGVDDKNLTFPTKPTNPDPPGIPRRLDERPNISGDYVLFTHEPQADKFYDSLELATKPELACPHHMTNLEDSSYIHCPLNVVNRNIFNTMDILIPLFHIHLKNSSHYPSENERFERQKRRRQLMFYTPCALNSVEGFKSSAYMTQSEYGTTSASEDSRSRCSSSVPTDCEDSDSRSDCDF